MLEDFVHDDAVERGVVCRNSIDVEVTVDDIQFEFTHDLRLEYGAGTLFEGRDIVVPAHHWQCQQERISSNFQNSVAWSQVFRGIVKIEADPVAMRVIVNPDFLGVLEAWNQLFGEPADECPPLLRWLSSFSNNEHYVPPSES